jgi:ankyrin repeat protein
MMAAPEAAKMKLEIDRGADVRAKAESGFTALMVAATYLGSSKSVKLLLEHGAEARPSEGAMFEASRCFSRPRPVTLITSPCCSRRAQIPIARCGILDESSTTLP